MGPLVRGVAIFESGQSNGGKGDLMQLRQMDASWAARQHGREAVHTQ